MKDCCDNCKKGHKCCSVDEGKFSSVATKQLVQKYKQMADERLSGSAALTFRLIAKELIKRKAKLESVNEAKLKLTKDKPKKITKRIWSAPKRIMTKRAYLNLPYMVKLRKNGVDYVNTAIGPNNTMVYLPVIFESVNEKTVSIGGEELMKYLMKRFKMSKSQAIASMKKHKMDMSFLKKESVNEAKITHSKGGYVEVGKWYLLNYGKWKDEVKVLSIDSKGMKVYNPKDNWRYSIPMTMIKKKKIGGYMTPIKESVNEGKKRYYQQDRVGSAKYTISYHDGKQKHKDGSDFFGIKTFRNKKDLAKFVNTLSKSGYVYGFNESVNEAGMGILTSDQADILQAIVMRNKSKPTRALLNLALKSGHFKGVDKKELLGYIDGARQFVKYMKSHPMESVNEISGIQLAKKVVKNKQYEKGMDLFTASYIVQTYNAYKNHPELRKKIEKLSVPKAVKLANLVMRGR